MKRSFLRLFACLLILTMMLFTCAWKEKETAGWHTEAEKDIFGTETGLKTVVCSVSGKNSLEKKFTGTVAFSFDALRIRLKDQAGEVVLFYPEKAGTYSVMVKSGETVFKSDSRDYVKFGEEITLGDQSKVFSAIARAMYGEGSVIVLLSGETAPSYTFTLEGKNFPQACFERADGLLAQKDYRAAYEEFGALKTFGYAGSAEKVSACADGIWGPDYEKAKALFDSGKYEEAKKAFAKLEGYKDSAAQVENCVEAANDRDYQAAKALFDSGKYEEAKTVFIALGTYKDSTDMALECDYQTAKAFLSSGKYAEAYAAFCALKGYKDVDTLLSTDDNFKAAAAALDAAWQPGKYVTFGRYEQDNDKANGAEAIEWRVLAREGSKALILSKYGLDTKPYNKNRVDITWEKCTLRTWLNGEFLNTAFDGTEQARIQQTAVDNGKEQGYSKWDTNGGNDTQDKVFLLSYAEANKYLGVTRDNSNNTEARVSPTAYAKANGAFTSSDNKTAEGAYAWWWWLRSPGYNQLLASLVSIGGSLDCNFVNYGYDVVRPALWVEIS